MYSRDSYSYWNEEDKSGTVPMLDLYPVDLENDMSAARKNIDDNASALPTTPATYKTHTMHSAFSITF